MSDCEEAPQIEAINDATTAFQMPSREIKIDVRRGSVGCRSDGRPWLRVPLPALVKQDTAGGRYAPAFERNG